MKQFFAILICIFLAQDSFGQSTYRLIEKGNRALKNENYGDSEIAYRKALEKDGKLTTAQYNIGNARYLQEDFEGAAAKFAQSAEAYESKQDKAHAFHNLGNSLMSQKKYEESIEAYKNALKLNPNDLDTKYNLAYAQQMLKKEQEQQQQEQEQNQDQENQENQEQEQEKNQEQDQEENKDQGEQEEEKDQGEEGDEEKEDQNQEQGDQEGEKEKPQQAKEAQLSKEQAEQLLKMLEGEEAKLQEKLDEPEGEAVKIKIEKDW